MREWPICLSDLVIKIPAEIVEIKALLIKEAINEHATAMLTVILEDEEQYGIVEDLNFESQITIQIKEEDDFLFSGIPISVQVKHKADQYEAQIILKSNSYKMDIEIKSRSFQNKKNLYQNIFTQVVNEGYEKAAAYLALKYQDREQKKAIIQFEETDWRFIMRLASQLDTVLVADSRSAEPRVWIGVLEGEKNTIENLETGYELEKDADRYLKSSLKQNDWTEEQVAAYNIETIQKYQLCDKIIYNGIELTVVKKEISLEQGILVCRYTLQKEQGVRLDLITNPLASGVSINGRVIAVENDCVKLHLEIDDSQEVDTANWYQLNTGYTTEGTTGLYSMPQLGDSAKLYIPNEYEETAYVRTINRTDGANNPKTRDPAIKYYENNYGKEMKLAPEEVQFIASDGNVEMTMNDGTGISITGNNGISVGSNQPISITGYSIHVTAADTISFKTKGSTIKIYEKIDIWGDGGVNK